jgi:NADPH:quinone reductase-like Zn-dependent oxidoreductase
MKALRIHRFGGPEVMQFEDIPVPQPKAGEILVKVCAASVNPVDHKTREGKYAAVGPDALPLTLGRDIAGIVEQRGSSANRFRKGDAIYAMLSNDQGAFAEFVLVKQSQAAAKPMRLGFAEAAAVPLAALTAWQGLFDHGQLEEGQKVLIHGGAGGVGHFAIQFAKVAGATVLTTVAGKDCAFVRELGADEAIDYKAQRFESLANDIDLVFDLVGGETQARSWPVLKRGGTLVSTLGQPSQDMAAQYDIRAVGYQAQPNAEELEEIADLIDSRRVRPIVSATFPFTSVQEAEQDLEKNHPRGKIVVDIAA